jgi:chemotaxis protein CheZ
MTVTSTYKRDQVVGIINSVLGKIKTTPSVPNETLMRELMDLRDIIESLRQQLRSTQASDISESHIPDATDELDAVVGTTEKATNDIMSACETVLESAKNAPPEIFQKIEGEIVKIFEACTFQDVTGQRIRKVVNCLKQINTKTSSILNALEQELGDITGNKKVSSESEKVVNLLNGPALPQAAVSQDDIDKMLAEFDTKTS